MKLFTVAILCIFLFKPANVANSQILDDSLARKINDKEVENFLLRQKIKSNRNEIDLLINQLREVKKEKKPVRKFYRKIFKAKKIPGIVKVAPVKIKKIDSVKIDSTTIEIPEIKQAEKKESFFQRILKIFKHD